MLTACGNGNHIDPDPSDPGKENTYRWVAVSRHSNWETSKRVDKARSDTADAWEASYRIGQLGYCNFTCRTLPTVEGVSGISTAMRFFSAHPGCAEQVDARGYLG